MLVVCIVLLGITAGESFDPAADILREMQQIMKQNDLYVYVQILPRRLVGRLTEVKTCSLHRLSGHHQRRQTSFVPFKLI